MVQECYTYVDKTPDKETKIKLIETLRTITEGKIYVEVERARLTHILAKIREEENNVAEAAKIIQELQVETYGSMDKREKVELILEQMRLCLAIKDYVRTQIISKKINTKFFEDEKTRVRISCILWYFHTIDLIYCFQTSSLIPLVYLDVLSILSHLFSHKISHHNQKITQYKLELFCRN